MHVFVRSLCAYYSTCSLVLTRLTKGLLLYAAVSSAKHKLGITVVLYARILTEVTVSLLLSWL